MGFAEVSNVLWQERELLELLLFKLEEEQLLIATGRTRWLPHATREVEVILQQIRHAEIVRMDKLTELTTQQQWPQTPSLRELSELVPPEWAEVFGAHRAEFLQLTHQVHEVAKNNRDSLSASHKAAAEALGSLEEDIATYDPRGRRAAHATTHPRTFLVDEAL